MIPELDVVVVNWNAGEHLRRCIDSLEHSHQAQFKLRRVVVVDNSSADGSTEFLRAGATHTLVENDANRGFAVACNQGAALGSAPLLLFLNPDVRLPETALDAAAGFLCARENAGVGIVGIQLLDDAGRVQRSCARFPSVLSMIGNALALDRLLPGIFPTHFMCEWDHGDTREVDQVMGAFFLVRRSVFQALNGFDQRFFLYFEDLDFARRARLAGWKSLFLATVSARHTGGVSSGQVPGPRLLYWLRSRALYARKHFGAGATSVIFLLSVLIEPWLRIAAALSRGQRERVGGILRAYAAYLREAPGLSGHAPAPPVLAV